MSTRVPLARRLIAALLLVLLNACYSWQLTTISPAQIIAEESPSTLRITLTDGRQLTLDYPLISNDSLVQFNREIQVEVSEVSMVEVRRIKVGATIVTIIVTPVVLVVVLCRLFCDFSFEGF